jgi:hypothetical protein
MLELVHTTLVDVGVLDAALDPAATRAGAVASCSHAVA